MVAPRARPRPVRKAAFSFPLNLATLDAAIRKRGALCAPCVAHNEKRRLNGRLFHIALSARSNLRATCLRRGIECFLHIDVTAVHVVEILHDTILVRPGREVSHVDR